jgi:GxxExxY protein
MLEGFLQIFTEVSRRFSQILNTDFRRGFSQIFTDFKHRFSQNMIENEITYDVRGAAFMVHKRLGPGLLQSVYEHALTHELIKMGHQVKTQVGIPVWYDDFKLDIGFRLDLLIDNLVIVEVKSVDQLMDIHHKQLLTYMKLTGKKVGLLINFNSSTLDKSSMVRIIN